VTQPAAGDFKAFTAICTHMGCPVGGVAKTDFSITYGAMSTPWYKKGPYFLDYTGTSFVYNNEGINFLYDYKTLTTIRYDRPMWSAGIRWQHLPSVTARS